jgi:DNA-binding transcriptional LysR family regulator
MQNIYSEKSNIGVRHFRYVIAVAAEGSFSAAANRLGVATSALTEAVQQVEQQTGALLFDRKLRPVALTSAGAQFVRECEQIMAIRERALRDLGMAGGVESGELALAAAPSLVSNLLVPAIRDFRTRHPGIRISVRDDVAGRVEARILAKEVEFAVAARWAPSTELQAEEIGRDEVGLVCSPMHRLAQRQEVGFEELEGETVISLMAETGTYTLLKASMQFPRRMIEGQLQAFSTISQLMMVQGNLGIAFLPRLAAGVIDDSRVVFVPIRGLSLWRSYYILSERRRTPSPAAEVLKDYIRKIAQTRSFSPA